MEQAPGHPTENLRYSSGIVYLEATPKMTTDFRKTIRSVVLSFQIPLRLILSGGNFGGRRLVAGSSAKDPANEGLEVLLVPEDFARSDLNVFDRLCSNDSGVAFEVALRFAESYRRNGMLSLDIQEFGAHGNNRVLLLF